MEFTEVTEENLLLYAAKNYDNPLGASSEDFYEDLKRIKYIKRLVNRYIGYGELSERLILNHLIVVFNVFDTKPTLRIMEYKFDDKQWEVLKPFLVFLKHIKNDEYTNIKMDKYVIDKLREI